MKTYAILFLFLIACSTEPEMLNYGKDGCHQCKMILMDKRFGAELVTVKGKIYKFDDVNCMISFLNSGALDDREVKYRLVVDFTQPAKLVDAGNSFYVKSSKIKSPMASQVAAFENYDSMNVSKKELQGIYLTWGELVTQFK